MKVQGWLTCAVFTALGLSGCQGWLPGKGDRTDQVSQRDDGPISPYGSRTRARARHILVKTERECLDVKAKLERGEDFATLAQTCSTCPSGQKGGDLGEFGRAEMSPEFDRVVFNEEMGKVHGPVRTKFGYHLIEITSRND